jgi:hypothetical protein
LTSIEGGLVLLDTGASSVSACAADFAASADASLSGKADTPPQHCRLGIFPSHRTLKSPSSRFQPDGR